MFLASIVTLYVICISSLVAYEVLFLVWYFTVLHSDVPSCVVWGTQWAPLFWELIHFSSGEDHLSFLSYFSFSSILGDIIYFLNLLLSFICYHALKSQELLFFFYEVLSFFFSLSLRLLKFLSFYLAFVSNNFFSGLCVILSFILDVFHTCQQSLDGHSQLKC